MPTYKWLFPAEKANCNKCKILQIYVTILSFTQVKNFLKIPFYTKAFPTLTWPAPTSSSDNLEAGLEKTRVKKKKNPAQWSF
jgi:hypothetical protein